MNFFDFDFREPTAAEVRAWQHTHGDLEKLHVFARLGPEHNDGEELIEPLHLPQGLLPEITINPRHKLAPNGVATEEISPTLKLHRHLRINAAGALCWLYSTDEPHQIAMTVMEIHEGTDGAAPFTINRPAPENRNDR